MRRRPYPARLRRVVGRATGVVVKATPGRQNECLFAFIRNVIHVKLWARYLLRSQGSAPQLGDQANEDFLSHHVIHGYR